MHMCTKARCKHKAKGYALKKAEARIVWLYTLDEGSLPAYAIHLYCEGKLSTSPAYAPLPILVFLKCKITYHHNFSVSECDDSTYE
jgi:hypothetical protein